MPAVREAVSVPCGARFAAATSTQMRRSVDVIAEGVFGNNSVQHDEREAQASWQVDLGRTRAPNVAQVRATPGCCGDRPSSRSVFVSADDMTGTTDARSASGSTVEQVQVQVQSLDGTSRIDVVVAGAFGRDVRVQRAGAGDLGLSDVKVRKP